MEPSLQPKRAPVLIRVLVPAMIGSVAFVLGPAIILTALATILGLDLPAYELGKYALFNAGAWYACYHFIFCLCKQAAIRCCYDQVDNPTFFYGHFFFSFLPKVSLAPSYLVTAAIYLARNA